MSHFSFPPRTAVYEIFVDRFAGPHGEALQLKETNSPWKAHAGGHLSGVCKRLEHITGIGCDALYLTPIFQAPSNHKYDVSDHYSVDEAFGGNTAFQELVKACRQKNVGLILDGVFNHVGWRHPWFIRGQQHSSVEEASFFNWIEHPREYECWQGHHTLPELNLNNPTVRETLITGENSVLRYWLRQGATGWRLDCANDLGPELCGEIAKIADAEQARDGAIGEVMAYAEDFVHEDGLHGVMNYYFRATVLSLLKGEISVAQAATNFKRMARRYHYPALLRSWNVLATHDTPRLASVLPDAQQRRFAFILAFLYPGVPLIYYGEEVGMSGGPDPMNRAPMEWDATRWDSSLIEFLRSLAELRKNHLSLSEGGYVPLPQPAFPTVLAFARVGSKPLDTVVVLANASDSPVRGRYFLPLSGMFDSLSLCDLLNADRVVTMESGSFMTELREFDVAVLRPSETKKPRYSFFSGYNTNGLEKDTK